MSFHPANPDFHLRIRHGARLVYDPVTAAVVMAGLGAASAVSQISTANKAAKATIQEGNIASSNKAKEIAARTASQRVSFLQSGLTLEGTPMNVIDSTFNTGIEDLNQIRSSYNTRAKNQRSAGRTAALTSIAGSLSGFAIPGASAGIGNFASDFGAGVSSLSSGGGFGLGYDVSQSFRTAGGGFGPGEFA